MSISLFPVVILAGGLATRLQPISHQIPKSMMLVNGEPFIAHQLRLLHANGITKVMMCVGYLGEQIVDFVKGNKGFGLDVYFSFDGNPLLGTAGAIKKTLPLLDKNFFVLYGDSYLTCDFVKIQNYYVEKNKQALMTVFHNKNHWDISNVEFNHGHIYNYDKKNITKEMQYIDYGLGIFNSGIFDYVPANEFYDIALLYQHALKSNQLVGYEVMERFYEIGSFAGIAALENKLMCTKEI